MFYSGLYKVPFVLDFCHLWAAAHSCVVWA